MNPLHDPWATAPSAGRRSTPGFASAGLVGAAAALGPAGRVVRHGFGGSALVLIAVAAAFGVALQLWRRSAGLGIVATAALASGAWVWAADGIGRSVVGVTLSLVIASRLNAFGPRSLSADIPPAPSVPALILTALSSIAWAVSGNLPLTMAGSGLAIAVAIAGEAMSLTPAWNAHILRWVHRVGDGLGLILSGLVAAIVLYPVGAIAAVAARVRMGRSTSHAPSTWQHPATAPPPRVATTRMYTATATRVALARNGVAVAVLAATAGGVIWVSQDRTESNELASLDASPTSHVTTRPQDSPPDEASGGRSIFETDRDLRFSSLEAYANAPWADALKAEQDRFANALPLDPITGHRNGDFDEEFTHVRDGERASRSAPKCRCRVAEVWFYGGSAAFGLGQRDQHTIASSLVELAERDGISLRIRNFGVPGWTRSNAVSAVEERLRHEQPPDLIVIYDGFNDVVSGFVEFALRGIDEGAETRFLTADFEAFASLDVERDDLVSPAAAATELERRLNAQRQRLATVADATDVIEFFQPDALASPRQFAEVSNLYRELSQPWTISYLRDLLERTAALSERFQINLRSIYDEVDSSVFSNLVHTNEDGALRSAEAMWPEMAKRLR